MASAANALSVFNKPVWILSHESQKNLALAIVQQCQEVAVKYAKELNLSETRSIEYKDILRWKKFDDGFPNLFIDDVKSMAGKDIIFVASFHSVDVVFEQISMLYQIPRYLAHSFTVIVPYFPTGTMERIDLEGQVATAKTLATILSEIPPTARGPSQIMIFDIHALQERFYFTHGVIPRMETAIPLVVNAIQDTLRNQPIAIVFPDDGAQKRFARLFPVDWPQIVCVKTRDGDKRIIRIKEGDANGRHVILIDDLVQSGGTLIEAAKALMEAGAISVSAYATHAVFPKESWRKFLPESDIGVRFANFWISDSLPHAAIIGQHKPFSVLSLSSEIAKCLLGFDLRQQ